MRQVVEYGGYANLVLFAVVALVALRQWRLGRGRAGLWAAISFAALALVVELTPHLDESPDRPLEAFPFAVLVLFPYFLYRFSTAFEPPTRRLEGLIGLMTLAVLVWTLALPALPQNGGNRSTAFVAYLAAFLLYWIVLTVVVAARLWRGGRGAPVVARRRLRVLAAAASMLTVAILLGAFGQDYVALEAASTVLAGLSALAFLIGLAPPQIVRLLWRRPENARVQNAMLGLMSAASEEEVAEQVAAPMAGMVGARAVALVDQNGQVIGAHGDSEQLLEGRDRGERDMVQVDVPFGQVIVWTSPYAAYFGGDEVRVLRTLGAFAGVALDRARMYTRDRELRLELEHADELKSDFIALAAHELRAPVTSINGIIDTLHTRGDRLDDEQRELLRQMLRDQGRRLGGLVDQLLDLSRLDADAIAIAPEPIVVRERVQELVRTTAGERAVEVQVDVPEDLEATVDPSVFDRILSNLVANALRYGEAPVIVHAEHGDHNFKLAVEDRGPGVPPDFVPDLFERFTRSRPAQERSLGTGLGLAIARSYANAHRGELVYEPASPTGARFELVLPHMNNTGPDVRAHRLRSYRRREGQEV